MPEVRIKFLKRQIKKKSYRKNIFAASSILMRILMALIKEKRTYELREDAVQEMERLELKYNPEKEKKKTRKKNKKKSLKKAA
jgi:hypothetical protein